MYYILGYLIFMVIITYLLAHDNPRGVIICQSPKKFFVKNKKILKYFRNPKYGTTKGFAIDHFAQLITLTILLPFYILYWINGCTAFIFDNLHWVVLFVFVFSVGPMLITGYVHARMQRYLK